MKRTFKALLFIAVTATTFASVKHFTGQKIFGPGFSNGHGCGFEQKNP